MSESDEWRSAIAPAEDLLRLGKQLVSDASEALSARQANGAVRVGHGDVRPEHVYVDGGVVRIIDPLDFSLPLRTNDVLSDIAFLVTDLYDLGSDDVAGALIRSYHSATMWKEHFPAVLSLFTAQKAAVRSYICWLQASESKDRVMLLARADRYARFGLCASHWVGQHVDDHASA